MDDVVTHWCIECDLSYRCEDEFSKHYNQIHRFGCDLCKNKFTHNMLLENHMKDHLDPRTSYFIPGARHCMDCDMTIKNESEFVRHIGRTHLDSWIRYKKEGNIMVCICIECELTYECEDGWECRCEIRFDKHYKQVQRFTCDLCEYTLLKEIHLKHHIENHHKPDPVTTVVGRDKKHV